MYKESEIDFLPTYKLKRDENSYVNKNDQSPSYCDRIIFKKNKPGEHKVDFYRSMPTVFGSDHRPV